MRIGFVLLLAGAVCAAASVHAGIVVYDNTPLSDPNIGFVAGSSNGAGNTIRANDFKLAGSASISEVAWSGGYLPVGTPPPTDNFTIGFYPDTGGFPDQAPISLQSVTVTRTATGVTLFGSATTPEFSYDATLPAAVALTGGTRYWISIFDSATAEWAWRTENTSLPGDIFGDSTRNPQSASPTVWAGAHDAYDPAFQLLSVPEPASASVLSVVAGMLWLRRERRRSRI